ncbi:hypothetical protein FACS1894164_19230 [Spirochaetia bacterium]|nr:hypothetical protein FACS1894164_19230 [Spirochaetia bacterium]
MKMKFIPFIILIVYIPVFSYAGGQSESAASNRGRYLTGLGYIYQPEEIHIDSLISKVDYDYPLPEKGDFNISTAADIRNSNAYIQIGIKGKKESFTNLPPMNISFVIDISGSMSGADKLSWVKDSFYIFINNVRSQDFVSVVIFDDRAELLIAPTQIRNDSDRTRFKRAVDTLQPRGGTDIFKGMNLGYAQVEKNYRPDYSNRVLLLTDGMHNGTGTKDDIISVVKRYNEKGINISTIALGASADINLVVDMATNGGGSSRFISDHDKMEQTFGSELDRLVVPSARMLNIIVTLSDNLISPETWGYKNWIEENRIHYSLDTLHNGDYETFFIVSQLNGPVNAGKIASITVNYQDLSGISHQEGPFDIIITGDSVENPEKIIDRRIMEAEGFVTYGKELINIGNLSNGIVKLQQEYYSTQNPENKDQLIGELHTGIDAIRSLSNYLSEINSNLHGDKYSDELTTLQNYEASFTSAYQNIQ